MPKSTTRTADAPKVIPNIDNDSGEDNQQLENNAEDELRLQAIGSAASA